MVSIGIRLRDGIEELHREDPELKREFDKLGPKFDAIEKRMIEKRIKANR